MSRISCLLTVGLLLFACCCRATEYTVKSTSADWIAEKKQRIVYVRFREEIPVSLKDQVLNPANYLITEEHPNQGGITVSSTLEPPLIIREVRFATTGEGSDIDVNRRVVEIYVSGAGVGKGKITVRAMKAGDDTVAAFTSAWIIEAVGNLSGTSFKGELSPHGDTVVASFSYAYSSSLRLRGAKVSRDWFSLEGSLPTGIPYDVRHTAGATTDSTEKVADFFETAYRHRTYDGKNFQSYGLIARTTGRLNAPEVVGNFQPLARFYDGGRGFLAAELEAGYRDGKGEWKNLTTKAPDRGNVVGRLGGVIEWAPSLGPINRDLGRGLRFFLRGRGWADYFKNDSGQNAVRLRGFLDTELFYNVGPSARAFVRFEWGYIPPDLSKRTQSIFGGIGTSF